MQLSGVRFLLIDGPNLIRRIHAAIPTDNKSQLIEQTISSTHQSLARALKQHTPTHVLCAFECDGLTWRHELFPDYKKDRPVMPEELNEIFARLQQEISENGILPIHIPAMEADDVIASAAIENIIASAAIENIIAHTTQ